MANLFEQSVWSTGIYQLEKDDDVLGGPLPEGTSNRQAKQLADRTLYLKNANESTDAKADSKEDKTNKAQANGYASLDASGKVPLSQISDVILGQMIHAGEVNAATALATLTDNGKKILGTTSATITLSNNTTAITGFPANQGNYYIVKTKGNFAGISFDVGDWLVANAGGWDIIKNTDAVTGIKGDKETSYRHGDVNLTAANIGAEPAFAKNGAFNKDFGTTEGTVANGNHSHANASKTAAGFCPALPDETTTKKYLRQDGLWERPPKSVTLVIGNAASGHTAGEVDYLVANGATNAQEVINTAISYLPAGGGEIIILEGTYNTSAPINILLKDNVTVRGTGNATVLNAVSGTFGDFGLVNINGASHCRIAGLKISNNSGVNISYGIYITGGSNNFVTGNTLDVTSGGNTAYGIFVEISDNNTVANNRCANSNTSNVYSSLCYGICVAGANNVVTGNICYNTGIGCYGIFASGSKNGTISGNICYNTGGGAGICYGIYINGASVGNAVTGNTCTNSGGSQVRGIYIVGANNVITGNTCANSGRSGTMYCYGIYIEGANNVITGNTCANSDPGTSCGIRIEGNKNTVNSNNIANNKKTGSGGIYAIWISPDANYCSVHGNNLRGVTEAGGMAFTQDGTNEWTEPGNSGTSTTGRTSGRGTQHLASWLNTGGSCGFNIW